MATTGKEGRPSSLEIWVTAARPHTLTASLSPCLVAFATSRPPWNWQVAWMVFCLSVQIGTNLHNDYADFVRGADTDKRIGHARATAKGWLTPEQTSTAATGTLTITFLAGVYLAVMSHQLSNAFVWFLILSSIFNAFAYTGGPFPLGYIGLADFSLGYYGLGDIFVLLYFGYVAVLTLPYLMASQGFDVDWTEQLLVATQVGSLATCILVVNNLRDRHTDVDAGKMTVAVRFGRMFSLAEYTVCLAIPYGLVLVEYLLHTSTVARLVPLVTLPLALKELKAVLGTDGPALNKHVGGAAKVQFAFCVVKSLSLLVIKSYSE